MSGFDNEVLYANNVDFSGGQPVTGKMVSNGQLLIGATESPNIRVGTLSSSDGTITITNGAGTIDLKASAAVGDVDGPASSTDNALARWDGTTGKLLQDSLAILDDNGRLTISTSFASNSLTATIQNNSNTSGADARVLLRTTSSANPNYQLTNATNAAALAYLSSDNTARILFSSGTSASVNDTNSLAKFDANIFSFMKGVAYKLTSTAISYSVLVTDYIVAVTDNSAARTISLPNTGVATGQTFVIKDAAGTAASANNITVNVTGGVKTIDGAASQSINTNYGSLTVYYNGTNYFII